MESAVFLLIGAALGGLAAWLAGKSKINAAVERVKSDTHAEASVLNEKLSHRDGKITELETALSAQKLETERVRVEAERARTETAELKVKLEGESKAAREKLALVAEAETKLADAFRALSADALKSNNQAFLDLAKTNLETFQRGAEQNLKGREQAIAELVKPLKESLEKVDGKIQELETKRTEAYSSLHTHLELLVQNHDQLRSETSNLVKALRAPQVRGRWGEMTLKRVAELAGMVEHCDFVEQESKTFESGRLRPDMVVKLPQGRQIVVDAKTPLQAYLDALEAKTDAEQERHLADHARHIQDHLRQLSGKAYWDQFQPTPEFVVLFVPGESFFSAALKSNPDLIEEGVRQRVILATPTTLIALLKSVSYGWRQEQLAKNAEEISSLARDLYERIAVLGGHFDGLGKALKKSVEEYNKAVGSLESRVLPQARKFEELGVSPKEKIPDLDAVEIAPRALTAAELSAANE